MRWFTGLFAQKSVQKRGRATSLASFQRRERIRQWAVDHPWGSQKDCAADLGFSRPSVSAHVQAIRSEWQGKS